MSEFYTGKSVIKDAATGEIKAYELSKDGYEYLEYEAKRAIRLEKRVEELEEAVKAYKEAKDWLKEVQDNVDKMESVLEENERYKQALEFYADRKNYEVVKGDELNEPYVPVNIDYGVKARKALERENNG